MGADEGSQEPFLSEGTSTLPWFPSFEKHMKQQSTEMLLEFENLTFSFFFPSFFFFFLKKKQNYLPLFGKLCAKEPVS